MAHTEKYDDWHSADISVSELCGYRELESLPVFSAYG